MTDNVRGNKRMKNIAILLLFAFLAGCIPKYALHSFAPFTTAEGVNGWRFSTVNYQENADIRPALEYEIGYRQLCRNGWEITKTEKTIAGPNTVVVYEGKCK